MLPNLHSERAGISGWVDAASPSGERLPATRARAPITRLFESLRPDLVRFAHWLAGDPAIAEDIVQEALLRAWRSRDALKDLGAARPWLLTIVRREHARLYERKRLEMVPLDAQVADTAGPENELVALRQAIRQLPLEYREPLVLQVLGGFSTKEIAHELALSPTAVLTRLFRARNKLRVICRTAQAPHVAADDKASASIAAEDGEPLGLVDQARLADRSLS